jgi:hypothetical protein
MFANDPAEHLVGSTHEVVQVHDPWFDALLAGEGEQLSGEFGSTECGAVDLVDV